MKKSKRKLSRTAALLAIQSAPVAKYDAPQGRESLRAFTQEYNEQQAVEQKAREDAALAPVRRAESEHSRLLRELVDNDITAGLDVPSKFLGATCPSIGDGSQWNGIAPEAIRATLRKAFSTAEDQLAGRLTEKGCLRCQQIARANPDIDFTQEISWSQLFYLAGASGLTSEDFVTTPETPEHPAESFEDVLESNSTFSRAGAQKISQAAMSSMQSEAASAFQIFSSGIERQFHYSLSSTEIDALIDVMKKRNLLFTSQTAWREAKLVCIKRGLLPRTLLSRSELFDEMIENADTQSWAGRQELRRQERLLGVPVNQVEY